MKKSILLVCLIIAPRFLVVCELQPPFPTRISSASDASTACLSPNASEAKPFTRRHYRGYCPKVNLDLNDLKGAPGIASDETPALLNPLTGFMEFPLSDDQEREIRHDVHKYTLAKQAPLYKQFLFLLGCAPHLRSQK